MAPGGETPAARSGACPPVAHGQQVASLGPGRLLVINEALTACHDAEFTNEADKQMHCWRTAHH